MTFEELLNERLEEAIKVLLRFDLGTLLGRPDLRIQLSAGPIEVLIQFAIVTYVSRVRFGAARTSG